MWDCYFFDTVYLSTDFLSGKGVPVLIASVLLPLDRNLLGTVVLVGSLAGSLWNVVQARRMKTQQLLHWFHKLLHYCFSFFLSVSFFLKLSINPSICPIPLFFTSLLYVPDIPVSQFVVFISSCFVFITGMFYEAENKFKPVPIQAQRELMALPHNPHYLMQYEEVQSVSVSHNFAYSIVVLLLSFYSSIHHSLEPKSNLSVEFVVNPLYSFWPACSAGLLRSYVVMRVAWVHTNLLHQMIEGRNLEDAGFWLTLLLFSSAWNGTLLTEQILTFWPGDRFERRMRVTALLICFSYLFLWEDPWVGFWLTFAFSLFSIVYGII